MYGARGTAPTTTHEETDHRRGDAIGSTLLVGGKSLMLGCCCSRILLLFCRLLFNTSTLFSPHRLTALQRRVKSEKETKAIREICHRIVLGTRWECSAHISLDPIEAGPGPHNKARNKIKLLTINKLTTSSQADFCKQDAQMLSAVRQLTARGSHVASRK